MKINLAKSSLILLCFSMAGAIGGGLYEQIVLTPLWSGSPPSSFSIIQPGTGVPLQRRNDSTIGGTDHGDIAGSHSCIGRRSDPSSGTRNSRTIRRGRSYRLRHRANERV